MHKTLNITTLNLLKLKMKTVLILFISLAVVSAVMMTPDDPEKCVGPEKCTDASKDCVQVNGNKCQYYKATEYSCTSK